MRRIGIFLTGLSVLIIAILAVPSIAEADPINPICGTSSCAVGVSAPGARGGSATSGLQTVSARAPSNGAGSGGGASSGPCPAGQTPNYQLQTSGGQPLTSQPGDVNPIPGSPGFGQPVQPGSRLLDIYCNGNFLTTQIVGPGGGGPAGLATPAAPRITGAQLARQAFAGFRVSVPKPVLSPATAVVNYPTWLWLEGGWDSQSATAKVPGLSATVTAAPTKVVWNMGDGGQATCDGPGVPWSNSAPNATTYCSYTYPVGGSFTATVTVYFSASFSASDGTGGQLGAVNGQVTFPVQVDEIQAVNTNS
jgi:hypothetical protein